MTSAITNPARIGSREWARQVIEDVHQMHGLQSERFNLTLYWFIAFLFARRTPGAMSRVSVNDLKRFDGLYISKGLPDDLQEAASDLWFQLYYGTDVRADDGNRVLREARKDLRRCRENVRTGMNTFRSNARLKRNEDGAKSRSKKSVFDWQKERDEGTTTITTVTAWTEKQFDGFCIELEGEQHVLKSLSPKFVEDFDEEGEVGESVSPEDLKTIREVLKARKQFELLQQATDGHNFDEEEVEQEVSALTDPLLIDKLRLFENDEAHPLNAALAGAMRTLYRSGREPNSSAIAEHITEQGSFGTVTHDRVSRTIKKLRADMLADLEAAKRAPAIDMEPEPTRAAKAAIISATVPAFLQKEFERTGPIKPEWVKEKGEEEKTWGWPSPMQRPGLWVNIVVRELPEDCGTWYNLPEPRPKVVRETEEWKEAA